MPCSGKRTSIRRRIAFFRVSVAFRHRIIALGELVLRAVPTLAAAGNVSSRAVAASDRAKSAKCWSSSAVTAALEGAAAASMPDGRAASSGAAADWISSFKE